MPGQTHLYVPGPTNVPDRVRCAMDIPQEDWRAVTMPEFTLPLFEDLKKVFKTESGQAFIFPSSGTGAWEAAISNTLSPGDKVLAADIGNFAYLWIDLCQRHKLDVDVIDVDAGEGVPVETFAERLEADKDHKIKAVLVTHNETSTGVTSDVAGVRKIMDAANHPALLYADGVSSIGCIDFRMDEWKVDLAITGSQKGLMLPTGLGIVCASQKALEARKQAQLPRTFFDFEDMIKHNESGNFPYTPAMNLIRGLREALNMLFEEGLENVFARHHRLAEGTRRAAAGWGLKLCAKEPKWYSDTVSAIYVPQGVDGAEVVKHAQQRYKLHLGGGLRKVAGKIFRIGHLGDLNELMLVSPIAGAEMTMRDLGAKVEPGSGVAAACEYWRETTPQNEATRTKTEAA
jgi:alanine-glyoxylate transaminase / serine-glyoxylate transaminase / serine-pyruvate transaminase